MKTGKYCTQNDGDCSICSLINYGRDCRNNAVAIVNDGYCQCDHPVIYCDKHRANHDASHAARLDACRANDTSPKPNAEEVANFFGDMKGEK